MNKSKKGATTPQAIKTSSNDDYVLVTVIEGDRMAFNKLEVTTPVHVDSLRDVWFGTTYLAPGMTMRDVDHSTMVNLQTLCETHLDEDNVYLKKRLVRMDGTSVEEA